MFRMNIFAISGMVNAVCVFILGSIVYFNNRTKKINIQYSLFCLFVAIWSFCYCFWQAAQEMNVALFWVRALMAGAIFIPVFFLHFVLLLLGRFEKQKRIVQVGYSISFIFFLSDFTSLFISNVRHKMFFKFWPDPGPLFGFFLVFWLYYCAYPCYLLIKDYRNFSAIRQQQIKYVLIGILIGYTSGSTNYFLWYNIAIPPFGNFIVPLFVSIMAYAIVAHHLMDIEVIIKKTLVFASLFTIVFGIFVGVALLIQQLIGAGNNILGFAISSLVIILTVRPLEIFLTRVTDKYLFQKKYDYKHLIKEFMDELTTMALNTNGIAQSTVDFFNTSIRSTNVAIFIYNKFTNKYDLIASSDFKEKNFKISNDSMLPRILRGTNKIIKISHDKAIPPRERGQLTELGVELVIPLVIHKELIGILCLGKKKSDEDYAEEDIETLSGLSGALAISLNNAQLFDERADAEKRALVGTIATGINHEIGNPLNIITIKLDTFRILAKEGMLEHKTKEQIIEEVNEITKVCLDSAQRIAEITKQVAEFAKPDKKLALDKVNVNEAIDETIAFLKHGMILDAGKIDKRILCDPVYAIADRGQLKQILFNLIKNASHAIASEKGKIIISVDKNGNDEIIIKIVDNGHGMSKEVMDKVFTPFFTTKDPGKGTGLGLALVKIMADRNNGRIKVESQEGEGTTFTLVFKGGLL